MRILNLVALAAVGLSVVMWPMRPAGAEVLKVMEGSSSEPLNVPMNRAVVLESETPFSELSIANPGIADISTLSDKSIYVLGKTPGRTQDWKKAYVSLAPGQTIDYESRKG